MKKIKVYLAGPIFTQAHINFNELIISQMEKEFPEWEIYTPHRNTAINDKTKFANSKAIWDGDISRMRETNILVALVSGDMPPAGTTCEVGYFCRLCEEDPKNHTIVALYDDTREASRTWSEEKNAYMRDNKAESQYPYINLLVVGGIKSNGTLTTSVDELFDELRKLYNNNFGGC